MGDMNLNALTWHDSRFEYPEMAREVLFVKEILRSSNRLKVNKTMQTSPSADMV